MKKLSALLAAVFLLLATPAFSGLDGLAPNGGSTAAIKADGDLEYGELYKRGGVRSVTVGGTADAIEVTSVNVATTALSDGLETDFVATGTNTGAVTYKLDGTTAFTFRRADGTALVAGDIQSGTRYRNKWHAATSQWRMAAPVQAIELRNVAAGNVAAVTVQSAINELDTEKQPLDSDLTTWAGVTPSANGQSLVSAADFSAMRTLLSLVPGTNIQAFDADLAALAGLASAADKLPYFTGSGTAGVADFSAFARTFLDDAAGVNVRATLGLIIGTDVQAFHARLSDVAGASWVQGDIMYFNGSNLVRLGPGTSGQFLKTLGAAANPEWATLAGGGDMLAANNLSDVASAATAFGNIKQAASTTATGVCELATTGEVEAGADSTRCVTADGVKAAAIGRKTVPLLQGAGTLPTGGGIAACTRPAAQDSGSNDVFFSVCQFAAATDNAIYFMIPAPKSSDETVDLAARIDWTSTTTTDATDDVIWTMACVAFSNDDAINGNAYPTVDTVTDTQTAAGDFLSSGEITTLTPAGTWAEGDMLNCRLTRDADNASDNFNGTADLINVQLFVTTANFTDD